MLGRILPALVVSLGSFVAGKVARVLYDKARDSVADTQKKKASAPRDLGTLQYDAETKSYRPSPNSSDRNSG